MGSNISMEFELNTNQLNEIRKFGYTAKNSIILKGNHIRIKINCIKSNNMCEPINNRIKNYPNIHVKGTISYCKFTGSLNYKGFKVLQFNQDKLVYDNTITKDRDVYFKIKENRFVKLKSQLYVEFEPKSQIQSQNEWRLCVKESEKDGNYYHLIKDLNLNKFEGFASKDIEGKCKVAEGVFINHGGSFELYKGWKINSEGKKIFISKYNTMMKILKTNCFEGKYADEKGIKKGYGKITLNDGTLISEGTFFDYNIVSGEKYDLNNNLRYFGHFNEHGNLEGHGKITKKDGVTIMWEGDFKNGELVNGEIHTDSSIMQGNFKNGLLQGFGEIFDTDCENKLTIKQRGIFEKGRLIEGTQYTYFQPINKNVYVKGKFNSIIGNHKYIQGQNYKVYKDLNEENILFEGILVQKTNSKHIFEGIIYEPMGVRMEGTFIYEITHEQKYDCEFLWKIYKNNFKYFEGKTTLKKIKYDDGRYSFNTSGKWNIDNLWMHGNFKNQKLEGKGLISTDFEGKDIVSKGTYKSGQLIEGVIKIGDYYYHGGFSSNEKLKGISKITFDFEGKNTFQKGFFKNGKLIRGVKKSLHDQWFVGEFDEKGNMHGECKICKDDNGDIIIKQGVFNHGEFYAPSVSSYNGNPI